MWIFIKKHNIAFQLLILIVALSTVSIYNLFMQRELLLKQMRTDSQDLLQSIVSSITRFQDIKATMSLQRLVRETSLELEIFEFRYIDTQGVVLNSMFHEEIGKKFTRDSFRRALTNSSELDKFYFDSRDYVPVMAITYPVVVNNKTIGYLDLSVDISEYDYIAGQKQSFAVTRRQVDVRNLLAAISGSIRNSINVFSTIEINDFLGAYVRSTKNIRQISFIDVKRKVVMSSDVHNIGTQISHSQSYAGELIESGGELIYRIIIPSRQSGVSGADLMLMLDAAPYAANERRLYFTAFGTSALTILMAAFIAFSIYRYNLTQAQEENKRLEAMVKERTHKIELLSRTDGLTGLWNRQHLEDTMELEFQRARRYGHELTLLILDLDHFKRINDNYGHLAGDEVLRETAGRIQRALRQTDFVGRYGGEEMVVLLPNTSLEDGCVVGKKLCEVIAGQPVMFESIEIPVTTSIGISAVAEEVDDVHAVLERADRALYNSKHNGRNQVSVLKVTD